MRQITIFFTTILLMAFVISVPSLAVEPDEVLDDPILESRAREISIELRCVVCQNQSIDDSDAEIARDLRLLVRERIVAGDSDNQVVDYIVARYGDFVLLRPPFQLNTMALWLAPPIMAVIIATLAILFYRNFQNRRTAETGPDPLSTTDRAELDALVDQMAAQNRTPPVRGRFRGAIDERLKPPDPNEQAGADERANTAASSSDASDTRKTKNQRRL